MIRLATTEDMPLLLRMGEDFFNSSGYGDLTSFNSGDTQSMLVQLINNEALLTDGKDAMLGYVIFPMFMNASTIVAQELFWWVDETARSTKLGIEILKAAEDLAKFQGATAMMMLSIKELDGERVNKLYSKLGYKEREQTYMRAL
jgi:hypothetical protein